ncbi:MAG: hypothetical protein PHV06_00990, partial [bacterium]|nr:hypothetical protein [bacterium]
VCKCVYVIALSRHYIVCKHNNVIGHCCEPLAKQSLLRGTVNDQQYKPVRVRVLSSRRHIKILPD